MTAYLKRAVISLAILTAALVSRTGLSTPNVETRAADLNNAWAQYLAVDRDRQPGVEFPYEECFRRSAAAHDLPLTLLLAVARGESDFDSRARSRSDAYGLMQILWPQTARHLGIERLSDLYRPCTNVDAGARYLKELLALYRGNLHLALAAYNYGPTRIPADGGRIPNGATWYSGYIYRHLQYVLETRVKPGSGKTQYAYSSVGKLALISFDTPYRAAAFVERVHEVAPTVRLEWFRSDIRRFRVVVLYEGNGELDRSKSALARVGFSVE